MSSKQMYQVREAQPKIDRYTFQELKKDVFLSLLFTGLENQVLLNVLGDMEFITRLRDMSSIEYLYSINESMLKNINDGYLGHDSFGINLLGKNVKIKSNVVHFSELYTPVMGYELTTSGNIFIQISDSKGEVIRTINQNTQHAGEYVVQWDGKNDDKNKVQEGDYTFRVVVQNGEGESRAKLTYITGKISGVKFNNGIPMLYLGDQPIENAQIMSAYPI